MRKVVLLFAALFLVGCSKGVDDIQMGMTHSELVKSVGEPVETVEGYIAEVLLNTSKITIEEAKEDKEHRVNTDPDVSQTISNIEQRIDNILEKTEGGAFPTAHYYEFGDDVVIVHMLDDKVAGIDELTYELVVESNSQWFKDNLTHTYP